MCLCFSYILLLHTHSLQLKRPNDVISQLLRVCQRDGHDAVVLGSPLWPILVALDPGSLFQSGQHDDGGRTLFPHHAPKVGERFGEGTLDVEN